MAGRDAGAAGGRDDAHVDGAPVALAERDAGGDDCCVHPGGLAAGVDRPDRISVYGVADAASAAPGLKLLGALPWAVPLIWVIALLNARGVGQLILWRRRQSETYGFQLLGLTILLVVLFDCGLESFATRVESYWAWKSPPVMEWYGAPLRCLVGCAAVTLLALVFSLPALMDKKPTPPLRNYQPLAIWVLLNLLCVTGAVVHRGFGRWPDW